MEIAAEELPDEIAKVTRTYYSLLLVFIYERHVFILSSMDQLSARRYEHKPRFYFESA